jgi:REP element-mobilizing transposase RayT
MEVRLKEIVAEVIAEKGAWLIETETMPDHLHLLVEVDPQFGVHKLVKAIKGRSSRVLRMNSLGCARGCPRCGPSPISWPPSEVPRRR